MRKSQIIDAINELGLKCERCDCEIVVADIDLYEIAMLAIEGIGRAHLNCNRNKEPTQQIQGTVDFYCPTCGTKSRRNLTI